MQLFQVLLLEICQVEIRVEKRRKLLHFDLLLVYLDHEVEPFRQLHLRRALQEDFGLRSEELLFNGVRKVYRKLCLEGNVSKIGVELRGEDFVNACTDFDLGLLVERCRKALRQLLKFFDCHHDGLCVDFDVIRLF